MKNLIKSKLEAIQYASKELKLLEKPITASAKRVQATEEEKTILKKISNNCEAYESDIRSRLLGIKDWENRIKRREQKSCLKKTTAMEKLRTIVKTKPPLQTKISSAHTSLDNSLHTSKKTLSLFHKRNKSWCRQEEKDVQGLSQELKALKSAEISGFSQYLDVKRNISKENLLKLSKFKEQGSRQSTKSYSIGNFHWNH